MVSSSRPPGKAETEFVPTGDAPWMPVPGPVKGIEERLLAHDPITNATTKLTRFAPGTDTSANGVQSHDTWEEVLILEGELHDLTLDRTFTAGMYACRPPGMPHGPWRTDKGCVTFDARYLPPPDEEASPPAGG
jgi:hypothetical protein